jgi:hypothetical protein
MGIVIDDTLTKINPTDPLRFAKYAARRKDSERFFFPILPKRTQCPRVCYGFDHDFFFQLLHLYLLVSIFTS